MNLLNSAPSFAKAYRFQDTCDLLAVGSSPDGVVMRLFTALWPSLATGHSAKLDLSGQTDNVNGRRAVGA